MDHLTGGILIQLLDDSDKLWLKAIVVHYYISLQVTSQFMLSKLMPFESKQRLSTGGSVTPGTAR
jgi:hypothetical protein